MSFRQKFANKIFICTLALTAYGWSQSSPEKTPSSTQDAGSGIKRWVLINPRTLDGAGSGSESQTAEAIKTFRERCPEVGVTLDENRAEFRVLIGRDLHRPLWRRKNKVAVFDHSGNAIFTTSTRSLGNAVKDACHVIDGPSTERAGSSAAPLLSQR